MRPSPARPALLFRRCVPSSLLLLAATLLPPALAGQSPDEDAVAATVDAFHAALVAGDSAAVLRLLADDAVIQESGGEESKAEYRSHHMPGDMRFAAAVERERGPLAVHVRGDVAWASSTSTTTGTMGERTINSRGAELMVLVRDRGEWRIAAIHWSSRRAR